MNFKWKSFIAGSAVCLLGFLPAADAAPYKMAPVQEQSVIAEDGWTMLEKACKSVEQDKSRDANVVVNLALGELGQGVVTADFKFDAAGNYHANYKVDGNGFLFGMKQELKYETEQYAEFKKNKVTVYTRDGDKWLKQTDKIKKDNKAVELTPDAVIKILKEGNEAVITENTAEQAVIKLQPKEDAAEPVAELNISDPNFKELLEYIALPNWKNIQSEFIINKQTGEVETTKVDASAWLREEIALLSKAEDKKSDAKNTANNMMGQAILGSLNDAKADIQLKLVITAKNVAENDVTVPQEIKKSAKKAK